MKSRTNPKPSQRNENIAQKIQDRAYELYVSRGQEPGHELDDWLQAEREVNNGQEQQKADG